MLLFTTSEPNLKATLSNISNTQIQCCCTTTSFQRGSSYQSSKSVSDIAMTRENELTASVSGGDEYEVSLQQIGKQVVGECDCPYDLSGACKHIVAVLLEAMRNKKTIDTLSSIPEMDIKKILLTKTKEQLVEWVMDYAPNDFFQRLKHVSAVLEMQKNPSSAQTPAAPIMESTPATVKQVREAAKNIRALFNDGDALENGAKFEKMLMKTLNTLRNVWYNEADEINAMLCEVLEKIGEAKENGELRDEEDEYDEYDDDNIFDETALYTYIKMFAQTLPVEERLFFLQDANAAADFLLPSIQIQEVFQQSELPTLKKVYLGSITSGEKRIYEDLKAYHTIEFMFSKEEWLSAVPFIYLLDEAICIRLVAHHQNSDENEVAYTVANHYFTNFNTTKPAQKVSENFYDLYITLAQANQQPFSDVLNTYLTQYPTADTLEKVIHWLPQYQSEHEATLKKASSPSFIQYLENKGRIQEAYDCLNATHTPGYFLYQDAKFRFLQRHGYQFPKDAIDLFEDTIRANEQPTGDKYYQTLTTCILALKEVDKDIAKKWHYYLTSSYSRRSNLMAMLRRIQF
jgi:hypothetical protein